MQVMFFMTVFFFNSCDLLNDLRDSVQIFHPNIQSWCGRDFLKSSQIQNNKGIN